jgi:hypothetical protein
VFVLTLFFAYLLFPGAVCGAVFACLKVMRMWCACSHIYLFRGSEGWRGVGVGEGLFCIYSM